MENDEQIGITPEKALEELPENAQVEEVEEIETPKGEGIDYEYSDMDNIPKQEDEEVKEELGELDEEDEGEFDYSDIEFDSRGVPVLNSKDLENICYYATFVRFKKEDLLMQIQSLYADIDNYLKYHETPEEERDPDLKDMYTPEAFESTKKTLASFQRDARSKDIEELENMNVSQVIENTNVMQLWITSLFMNHIVEKDNVFDNEISLMENFASNNYYSLFLKEVIHMIEKKTANENELKRYFEPDFYTSLLNKFSYYYRTIFYHLGTARFMYRLGAQTNRIQDSINSIIPEFYHKCTRYAFIHDEKVKERFRDIFQSDSEVPLTDADIEQRLMQVRSILEKDQMYYELNNYMDDEKLLEKSGELINRIYDLSEKFTKDFPNKASFINLLTRICNDLSDFVQTIFKKFKVENIEELTSYIIEECKKYEEPPEDKKKDLEKLEREVDEQFDATDRDQKEVENARDEIEKFTQEQKEKSDLPQGKRDKFTPNNYPYLEMARYTLNLLRDIVDYIENPDNLKKANILIMQLVYNFINNVVYSVIDSHGFYRKGRRDFIYQMIDLDKPISELNPEEIIKENKENPMSPFAIQYQEELLGVFLEELSTAITVTEVCKTSDDMMSDLYMYYNTHEHQKEEESIRAINLCYKKNNVMSVRYMNMKSMLKIYNLVLDFVEKIISEDNNIAKYESEIWEKEKQQAEYLQQQRNKRKPRSKRKHK